MRIKGNKTPQKYLRHHHDLGVINEILEDFQRRNLKKKFEENKNIELGINLQNHKKKGTFEENPWINGE